jgi:hypothetical protein
MSRAQDKRQQPPATIDDLSVVMKDGQTPRQAEITVAAEAWRGYTFRVRLDEHGEDFASVEILRDTDAAPLNSWRLQHVPIALFKRAMLMGGLFQDMARARGGRDAADDKRSNRGDDLKLAKLARGYVETLGEPHQSQVLAERFGYRPNSIAKLIRRARERHLLTGTTKGSPGGVLTPKSLALLGEVTPEAIKAWAEDPIENAILKGMQDHPGGEVKSLPEALEGDRRPA